MSDFLPPSETPEKPTADATLLRPLPKGTVPPQLRATVFPPGS
jgi:hypothetical protein